MKRFLLLAVVLLTLAACNTTNAQSGILSLGEIAGGADGPYVRNNTGESVLIEFTTGAPTVCNVTYGTDEQYGTIATDMMLNGPSRDHTITLGNLVPNTTYHYRLNLTDEQGNLYQSEDYTFTTQSSDTTSSDSTQVNIAAVAAGARVSGVSSNYGDGDNDSSFGGNHAIDERQNTQWSSNGDGNDAWIEIELSGDYDISEIGFWSRTMSNNTATIFTFSVTTDRGETYGPFELPDAAQLYTFPVSFTAKVLRFDALDTNTGNTGAVEITAYGTPHTP